MTLVELLVSMGISSVIMVALLSGFLAAVRAAAALGNYAELDHMGHVALDRITRDVRTASKLTSYATNQLTFQMSDGGQLALLWDPATQLLTRTRDGSTIVLLKQCQTLTFNISQRSPLNDGTFGFFGTETNPALCKMVGVTWRCSRKLVNNTLNTESVQSAKVLMRN